MYEKQITATCEMTEASSKVGFSEQSPRSLQDVLLARDQLKSELEKVEMQIFRLEANYIQAAVDVGTVLDGWVAYSNGEKPRSRKRPLTESSRIFTLSSSTGLSTAEKFGALPTTTPVRRKLVP